MLTELGFQVHSWNYQNDQGQYFSVSMAGFLNLKKWIEEVKPSNQKHMIRISEGLSNIDKVNIKKVSQIFKSPQSYPKVSPDGTAVNAKDC